MEALVFAVIIIGVLIVYGVYRERKKEKINAYQTLCSWQIKHNTIWKKLIL